MKRSTFIITIILAVAVISAGFYWFFYINQTPEERANNALNKTIKSFSPFNRDSADTGINAFPIIDNNVEVATTSGVSSEIELPKLRKIYALPVASMSASSTGDSSVLRFIDRGTGHVFEALSSTSEVTLLSNTTLPKVAEGYWNKNLTTLVLRYLKDAYTITNLYAELRITPSATSTSPFELKGKYLSDNINQVAVSPLKDKIFTWNIENGRGIGYTSLFDEKNKTKIIDSPIRAVVVEWPENNTVTLTTKASASASGYLYNLNTKTGLLKKIMGGDHGLSTKTSGDLSKVLYSSAGENVIKTSLLITKDGSVQDVIFKTLADKCMWSNLHKEEVYCAVPTNIPEGIYPDDWYKGNVSFVDQIWHLNTVTGEVHLLANLLGLSRELVDAVDLTLDPNENFLYFINKRDLSLWSLDLNK